MLEHDMSEKKKKVGGGLMVEGQLRSDEVASEKHLGCSPGRRHTPFNTPAL